MRGSAKIAGLPPQEQRDDHNKRRRRPSSGCRHLLPVQWRGEGTDCPTL